MDGRWLTPEERQTWVRLLAVVELLPGALDAQLRREAGLTHFDYFVLAMLSEAEDRTLGMAELARTTNATPPRLSHVVRRLEERGLVERVPHPDDRRAVNARLTSEGAATVGAVAPRHVETVRQLVFGALTGEQVASLREISDALLARLDPEGQMTGLHGRR